ncbi:MAG: hypothetical protein PHX21_07905 [bacterium]|nr:hypothetical protein [bacterium]
MMGNMMGSMAGNKIIRIGGGILFFLPILLYSGSHKGISFSCSATDNLYMLDIKEGGSIVSINPFWQLEKFFDFKYDGKASSINFDISNPLFENYFELQKKIYLHGVGNKNIVYSNLYSFFPMSYEIFQVADFVLGDSLNVYLCNRYLFSSGVKLKYKQFYSDSIKNYLEPSIKLSISTPLPYCFLMPSFSVGSKIYEQEKLLFYQAGSNISFPLLIDLSLTLAIAYYKSETPSLECRIPEPYNYDMLFKEEIIRQSSEFNVFFNKLFLEQHLQLNMNFSLFENIFFEVVDTTRKDTGIRTNLKLLKTLNKNLFLSLQFESLFNWSIPEEFTYTKNSAELNFGFIF